MQGAKIQGDSGLGRVESIGDLGSARKIEETSNTQEIRPGMCLRMPTQPREALVPADETHSSVAKVPCFRWVPFKGRVTDREGAANAEDTKSRNTGPGRDDNEGRSSLESQDLEPRQIFSGT
ncbi:hypothetical protein DFH09DRAFT_1083382 [Mycena vulgaris]|nr:hypothetical protein DFH09DRAFT_1083382 [Mycena vulgaris]